MTNPVLPCFQSNVYYHDLVNGRTKIPNNWRLIIVASQRTKYILNFTFWGYQIQTFSDWPTWHFGDIKHFQTDPSSYVGANESNLSVQIKPWWLYLLVYHIRIHLWQNRNIQSNTRDTLEGPKITVPLGKPTIIFWNLGIPSFRGTNPYHPDGPNGLVKHSSTILATISQQFPLNLIPPFTLKPGEMYSIFMTWCPMKTGWVFQSISVYFITSWKGLTNPILTCHVGRFITIKLHNIISCISIN